MSLPIQRQNKIVEVKMDDTAIYRQEEKIGLQPFENEPIFSEVT